MISGTGIQLLAKLIVLGLGGVVMVLGSEGAGSAGPTARDITIRQRGLSIQTHLHSDAPGFDLLVSGKAVAHAVFALQNPIVRSELLYGTDADYGQNTAVKVTAANGDSQTVALYASLPFAVTSLLLKNSSSTAREVNKLPVLTASLPVLPANAISLGTGGLKPASDGVGSYAWAALANAHSGDGVVGGFLTHEKGNGVLFPGSNDHRATVSARLEYGRLIVPAASTVQSELFAIGWFADARLGMEAWADAVARKLHHKLPAMPIVYCTWYDNVHGGSSDQKALAELSEFAARTLKPFGLGTIQIDDGWQMGDPHGNGPRKNFSQYDPNGPYRDGMKATADKIAADGLRPGLWILPFGGSYNDAFFAKHQDWFVKTAEGKPFDTAWGGTALDMTQPGAIDFVRGEIAQSVSAWGYGYLKLDGLSTGVGVHPQYVNDAWKEDNLGDGYFSVPTKPHIEVFRDGLRMIRNAAGPTTFILGCCAPQNMRSYAGVFGLVDAMRMGPDNGGNFKNWLVSPDFGSRNYHLNGRIWWSDPDPMYVRDSIPLASAECIASWNALSGQMVSLSDWLPGLPENRLELIKRCIPGHGVTARPVDIFESWPPRMWTVSDTRAGHTRRDVVGLFNWSEKPSEYRVAFKKLGIPAAREYSVYDFWAKRLLSPAKGELALSVPGEACRVLAIRPSLPHPFVISTSRHVSQGILELTGEDWNPGSSTLSGVSEVVGADNYELRVVATKRALLAASVSAEDVAAGVSVTSEHEGDLLRVHIASPTGRKVAWKIIFQP